MQPLQIECVIKHIIPITIHTNGHSHGLTIQQNITKMTIHKPSKISFSHKFHTLLECNTYRFSPY
jgi:hypothetical protein